MTLFIALAVALTAAALAFLLPPLLRQRGTAPDARVAANAEIYREQLDELGVELQRGTLTKEEFERASREVERRIVAEHMNANPAGSPMPARAQAPRAAALAVAILVPLAASLGYWQFGEPRGLEPQALLANSDPQMEALIERLAGRLQQKPDDAEGWALLGRSLISLGRHAEAAQAMARAVQVAPEDRELLTEFIKSLAIAGRAAFEQRQYADAVGYWERILPFAAPETEFHRTVSESIDEAKSLAGGAMAKSGSSAPAKAGGATTAKAGAGAAAAESLKGVVRLDPALKGKAAADDVVFILARPAEAKGGPPVAVTRITVAQLPFTFTLDDSMAMAPAFKLSGQKSVVVTARISKSGKPARQPGDLEGASAPLKPGTSGLDIVISKTVD